MIIRLSLYAAAVLTMGFAGELANAAVIYSDSFNSEPASGLNITPQGWGILGGGTVDTIPSSNGYGINCGGSNFCIDTDGSTGQAGEMVTVAPSVASIITLNAGQTYQLSVDVSGNQRNGAVDNFQFGFLSATGTHPVLADSAEFGIPGANGYNLYTLTYTPTTQEKVELFVDNVGGTDNQGPVLNNVTLQSVPLPASAWLLLSALAGVGLIGRRRLAF